MSDPNAQGTEAQPEFPAATCSALYDRTGREIRVGDVLKIFHFTGARRKRYYMYQYVLGRRKLESGTELLHISYLGKDGPNKGWHTPIDGRCMEGWEIVQGAGPRLGLGHEDRPKTYVPNAKAQGMSREDD